MIFVSCAKKVGINTKENPPLPKMVCVLFVQKLFMKISPEPIDWTSCDVEHDKRMSTPNATLV